MRQINAGVRPLHAGAAQSGVESPSRAVPVAGYAHILVPVALNASDAAALRLGSELAAIHQSRLTVLLVVPPAVAEPSYHWLDAIDRLHVGLSSNTDRLPKLFAPEDSALNGSASNGHRAENGSHTNGHSTNGHAANGHDVHAAEANGKPLSGDSVAAASPTTETAQRAMQQLNAVLRRELGDKAGMVTPRVLVHDGDLATAIVQFAEDEDADLVVMAGRSQRAFLPVLPGHVRRVLRKTQRAVILA